MLRLGSQERKTGPKTPLECKEIQLVYSEGDQPWDFFGRNDAKAETPVLWPPHAKSWFTGKDPDAGRDWGQEEKGTTEDEMAGWHHWLNGRESQWTLGVADGQGGLACCDFMGSQRVRRLSDWSDLILTMKLSQALLLYGWPSMCGWLRACIHFGTKGESGDVNNGLQSSPLWHHG